VGMRLRFRVDEAGAQTRWVVTGRFQGFRDVLHGGLVLALCDDAMWYAAFGRGGLTMTAEATVRYRGPVQVGTAVLVRGWVTAQRGRLWTCAAELTPADGGAVLATAQGKFLPAPPETLGRRIAESRVHEFPEEEPGVQ